jgi:hypothetical protein
MTDRTTGIWQRILDEYMINCFNRRQVNITPFTAVLRIRIRDPGSGAFLTPGSGIGFFRIPDLGSRIPNPYFWELIDNFLGKKFHNSLKIGPNFFLQHIKLKYVQFCEICGYIKSNGNKFFFTPHFCCYFWIRDPRSVIWDPGWVKIRIRDPG